MQLFKLKTRLSHFDHFSDFAKEFDLSKKDLVITNDFLYTPYMKNLQLPCRFIMQENFGSGEPSDEMINQILGQISLKEYDRIIAVGGGTVIDISKLFVIRNFTNATDAFQRHIPIIKEKQLIILPTTCGTGSEVTNISIAEIKSLHTKMGLADDAILADDAVLIPEFLEGLPYNFFIYSSIDALIHAVESYVSPRTNSYTQLFCRAAIKTIMDVFIHITAQGPEYRFTRLADMLTASNYAGIAFGNTGVGAVHALSYPLGGNYHVPHGEANYQFFTEVFKLYNEKKPDGIICELNTLLATILHSDEKHVYEELDYLLGKLLSKNPLHTYGMKQDEIERFTNNVLETQQRLLANNYVELTKSEIKQIYTVLY
ncbi:4-hydroxybutyrate dehydrogenase [Gabonibacter massiliensis]|uniref:4-hydroxybutyrate dehydrogenase n=1 Tax=Gabonibacter massiliensis TaxID=1720195 RepID=UPI00073E45D4|nr:4-hydroxybutyrate dehydrogenase [Gabonibacter massiliensis]